MNDKHDDDEECADSDHSIDDGVDKPEICLSECSFTNKPEILKFVRFVDHIVVFTIGYFYDRFCYKDDDDAHGAVEEGIDASLLRFVITAKQVLERADNDSNKQKSYS